MVQVYPGGRIGGAVRLLRGVATRRYAQDMETAERLITAQEFLAREDRMSPREELIDGRIVRSQPDLPHQTIAGRIHLALATWANEAPARGVVWLPIDIVVDERHVLVPDLAWVAEEKVPPPATRLLPVSPDLVVEVRSPSTWHRDIGVKRDLYARHGVRELWLVDGMSASVIVCRLDSSGLGILAEIGAGQALESPLLPGFSVELDALFAERRA